MPDHPEQSAPARRGRPGYDQETVVRRATELFIRQGYDRTSMGDVARELGLVKSAIYHHVPGKEALLAAALDEGLDALSAGIDRATASGGSAYDRLRAAVHTSVVVLVEHLPAVTLLLRLRGNGPVEQAALQRRRELDERLADLVAAAVAEGAVRSDVPAEVVSRLLFGTVNSLVEWWRPDGPLDGETLARTVVSAAFDGLVVPQASKSTETASPTG